MTYSVMSIISFPEDRYSWRADYGSSSFSNLAIRMGGLMFGSKPFAAFKETNREIPVVYPRNMWFFSTGKWR